MSPLEMKCRKCGVAKPLTREFFFPHKECRYGLTTTCKTCCAAYQRAWKKKNREIVLARRRAVYAATSAPVRRAREQRRSERAPWTFTARILASSVSSRGAAANIFVAAELRSKVYVEEWLRRQPNCECCGIAFRIGRSGTGEKADHSPSFDKFDCTGAYTLENTALICWRCNNIKRNYVEADLRQVADWMEQRRPSLRAVAA